MTDWPHDPDGDEGSEGMRKYGQAVLAKKVEEDEFPLTRAEFSERHGDEPVRIDHETVVSVDDILEHCDADEFEDITDFHGAMGRALRAAGYWPVDIDGAADRA
jgi:hypothetical protein